jgi:hypothetical protein
MADFFGKLVVRSHTPRRRAVLLGAAALLALLILYAAFELGRYDAGFRVVDSVRGALSASARIRELEAENVRLSTQLEAADVARRVDREGYKQVERSLGDMQSQIARLNQDLSFYRGLVQPDSLVHVKVQQMQIVPETAGPGTAARYRLPRYRPIIASAWHTHFDTSRTMTSSYSYRRVSSRRASGSKFTAAETRATVFDKHSSGRRRGCRLKRKQTAATKLRVG